MYSYSLIGQITDSILWFLCYSQRVRAAAYIVPHPLESRMEIRIETVPNEAPAKALKAALNKVAFTCDDFSESFESSLTTFRNRDTMEVEDSRLRQ